MYVFGGTTTSLFPDPESMHDSRSEGELGVSSRKVGTYSGHEHDISDMRSHQDKEKVNKEEKVDNLKLLRTHHDSREMSKEQSSQETRATGSAGSQSGMASDSSSRMGPHDSQGHSADEEAVFRGKEEAVFRKDAVTIVHFGMQLSGERYVGDISCRSVRAP